METSQLLNRVHELEKEIQCIKDVIEPPNRGKLIVQNGLKFILAYWPIFSVIVALGTILYVRTVFGVDYFENYRSIATTKKLSQFYSQMGDKLLYQQEWEAAEDAYQKSLEIDKNNVNATYGIAKAQVFQPLEGQQYYVNEIVLTKLDYLLESFPEDYQVYFLKGLYFQNQNDFANARAMYNMAIMKNPRFDDGFLSLGYLSMQDLDLSSAIGYFEKTLQIEPGNTLANNNVGFCYLILLDFNGAIPHLEQAWQISPSLLTLINLGDAYLFSGEIYRALAYQEMAQRIIEEKDIEDERFVGGEWVNNYMPLQRGDLETPKNYVKVYDMVGKQMMVYYNLSFGYAITGDFEKADREFAVANQLDTYKDYDGYYAYKIRSILNLVTMSDASRTWFENHEAYLETN